MTLALKSIEVEEVTEGEAEEEAEEEVVVEGAGEEAKEDIGEEEEISLRKQDQDRTLLMMTMMKAWKVMVIVESHIILDCKYGVGTKVGELHVFCYQWLHVSMTILPGLEAQNI